MSRIILYPYKMASASVKALEESLSAAGQEVLKVYPDRKFKPRKGDTIVNWGNGAEPTWYAAAKGSRVLNRPKKVSVAGNKLLAFRAMREYRVHVPDYTDDQKQAQAWVNAGSLVVVRGLLRGHSGAGISLVSANLDTGDTTGIVPEAPLYTTYVKKMREYRVHVFGDEVIYWQQKMLRKDFPKDEVNHQIRNHASGWIYATEAATPPNSHVTSYALAAVTALGLKFGAVDVVWNQHKNEVHVLEVNTAPGLEGSTIEVYSSAIIKASK